MKEDGAQEALNFVVSQYNEKKNSEVYLSNVVEVKSV